MLVNLQESFKAFGESFQDMKSKHRDLNTFIINTLLLLLTSSQEPTVGDDTVEYNKPFS